MDSPLDDDGAGCSCWNSLGHDLQLAILSILKRRDDKVSLQAVLQTSSDLRRLGSSLISSIEIRDAYALNHFPRHATAITSMELWMCPSPGKEHMAPPCMVSWLQFTSAACDRLGGVTNIRMELPQSLAEDEEDSKPWPVDPATMDNLLTSIGQACSSLRSLYIGGIDRANEELVRTMFSALGQHLPNIVELQLDLAWESDIWDFDIAGIDWAACLPRGLRKFSIPVRVHHELLQHLVQMPSLAEVAIFGLGYEDTEVQSDGCAWRILQLDDEGCLSCKALGRFTTSMPLLHLYSFHQPHWNLDATSEALGPAVSKAAAWLSKISNCPEELTIGWEFGFPDAAFSADVISALAPLSGLVSLELDLWLITEGTLDKIALTLPNVNELTFKSCSISSGAWLRMLTLSSLAVLTISRWPIADADKFAIPLSQIIAFTAFVLRPMTLNFNRGCVSDADHAGWDAFKETLEEQRRSMGLPKVTVHITSG